MILVLDWAAKYTAGMVMDRSGAVQYQFDSWGKPSLAFCAETAEVAAEYEVRWIVAEDVPHGIKNLSQTKPVVRTQGVLANELDKVDLLDQLRFVQPAIWQRTFEGVWKGGTKGARAAAARLGYTPPNLLELYAHDVPDIPARDLDPEKRKPIMKERGDVLTHLRKQLSDYDDAFLIGRWAQDLTNEELIAATQEYFPL